MDTPKTRYARSRDGTYIAYQVFGTGPDLLLASPWISHLELAWEMEWWAEWLWALGRAARVIAMDQRGMGLSDRMTQVIDLETRVDDVRAVLDAADSDRATLYGQGLDGGAICAMFAATHPDRTAGLLLWTAQASGVRDVDYPWAPSASENEEFSRLIAETWGDEDLIEPLLTEAGVPLQAKDPTKRRLWARLMRYAASRGDALVHERVFDQTDYRGILPSIHVPTAILQPEGTPGTEEARWVASQIPDASVIPLPPSAEFPPELSNPARNLEAVRAFLSERRAEDAAFDRILATVLFTDVVDSTAKAVELGDRAWKELAERHHEAVRSQLARYRGQEIDTAGDGFFAAFDGPARAVRCAEAIGAGVRSLGIEVRAGLHTGECEVMGDKVGGIAVHIGARVAALARPGEVLVSNTVKDLVAGSGLVFEERGEHTLKGVPGEWRLYAVRRAA